MVVIKHGEEALRKVQLRNKKREQKEKRRGIFLLFSCL